ncbi:cation:dicarboxylase symporter family transporter [Oscillatoria amoena NRMC-F 0135]|nr:cation:dicarboxylase symporter family transporter [Oscillatoria amoena NRMC-F 0135]
MIDGISNLSDVSKLSRIGGRTIGLYLATTVIAVTIGLVLVNVIKPGKFLSSEKREELSNAYASDIGSRISSAQHVQDDGPLQILVDIVPENVFGAMSNNSNMLQIIFFAMLFGVAMILAKPDKIRPVKSFFDGANAVILKIVDMIMRLPRGVLRFWQLKH